VPVDAPDWPVKHDACRPAEWGSMTGGCQRVRRMVAVTVLAAFCATAASFGAASADVIVTAQCAERPTASCIVDAGLATMGSMVEHPDPLTELYLDRILGALVHAKIELGDLAGAYAVAKSLKDLKQTKAYEDALDSIAIAEARTGDLDEATRLLDSVKNSSRTQLLIAIAKRRAGAGNKRQAEQALAAAVDSIGAIGDDTERVMAMVGVAEVMADLGDEAAAAAKLREARELADGVPKEVFRSVALSVVASTHAKMGDLDTALSIARSIPRNSFRSGELLHVVKAAVQQNKSIDAVALVAEAAAIAREDTFPVSRANSLGDIAALLSFLGDHGAADRMLEEALGVAEKTEDRFNHASALHAVAVAFARSGNAKRGVEVAATIDLTAERALAFFGMATAMATGY
jgi:tetratricopeptide (TPR) repeat protein